MSRKQVQEARCTAQEQPGGLLDGLARTTERYGSNFLKGDASQFAEVTAYQQAHKDDYWRQKKP
jgi:hypothetical protein